MPEELHLEFSDLNVNLFTRSLLLTDVTGNFQPSGPKKKGSYFSFPTLQLKGIHLSKLLSEGDLKINHVSFSDESILVVDISLDKDSVAQKEKKASILPLIAIGHLEVQGLQLTLKEDTLKTLQASVSFRINKVLIQADKDEKKILFEMDNARLSNLESNPTGNMYSVHVSSIAMIGDNMMLDSIRLTPKYPKIDFAHELGKQTDRIQLFTSQLAVRNCKAENLVNGIFTAELLQFKEPNLHVFRDKRLPFIKKHETPLPVISLNKLPIQISVDTIEIKDASIRYEEFPEKGAKSGMIEFNELNALLFNLSNFSKELYEHKPVTMDVNTKFMGNGLLRASFDFPVDSATASYKAQGRLVNFDLTSINPALIPLAGIEVESGILNAMNFNFVYNDKISVGTVDLLYENLKIKSLQEKNGEPSAIDVIKTFLLNTFIIRRDYKKEMPKENRSGEISFERDKKRSIFNYWWKSILSGLTSAYGLDTILAKEKKNKK